MKNASIRCVLRIATPAGDKLLRLNPREGELFGRGRLTDHELHEICLRNGIEPLPELGPDVKLIDPNLVLLDEAAHMYLRDILTEAQFESRFDEFRRLASEFGYAFFTSFLQVLLFWQRDWPRLQEPFGHHIYMVLEFLCSPPTMSEIVNQTIADIREEECEALQAGRMRKAKWIRVRGHYTLAKALGFHAFVKLLVKVVAAFKSAS